MYLPINSLGYPQIKKLQRDNLWHAYNEPINIDSEAVPADKFQNCIKSKEEIYSVSTIDINFLVQKNAWTVNYLNFVHMA